MFRGGDAYDHRHVYHAKLKHQLNGEELLRYSYKIFDSS